VDALENHPNYITCAIRQWRIILSNSVLASPIQCIVVLCCLMEFIETQTFTRDVLTLLSDDEYRGLQNELVADPARGDLIKGGGGIRKLRYAIQGRGKSGGVRAIYYFQSADDLIYMLVVYPKSKKDNLSLKEIEQLRKLVKEL
jgi:hypothetical protein